jgi:endo-1,4-beta-xylanase
MQGHMGMKYPESDNFEKSILSFSNAGVNVMITEWDMSALPNVQTGANIADTVAYRKSIDPYTDGLPDAISQAWNNRMKEFFNLFLKHSNVITRVTVWGLTDGDSWKNGFPVRGRVDYPLLFDRHYMPKPFVQEIMEHQADPSR